MLAVVAITTFGLKACSDTVNVNVRTVDQDGKPVADAKVSADADKGSAVTTDDNGEAMIEISRRVLSNRFYAECLHYYSTKTDENYCPLNPNVDLSKTVIIVMKKIKKPIPMYAKSFTSGHGGLLKLPSYDGKSYGFDLVIGDWVFPHGKGATSDLILKFVGQNSDQPYGRLEQYDDKFIVAFSNTIDGIYSWQGLSDNNRAYGSEFASEYEAPATGYKPEWVQRTWKEKGGYHQSTYDQFRNYYFRVRTKVDENGNIVSAHYGKIYGDFMSFTYYLNATPNDRNVEFDPKQNLFPEEKVTKP